MKITDFGIARVADQVSLTATGQVMGTVQYLAPEQATGKGASPATDLYSLGIVAYEALVGKRPFTGGSQMDIAMAQINDDPPAMPENIDQKVRDLIMKCLAKKPFQRPANALALAAAAESLMEHPRRLSTGTSVLPNVRNFDTTTVLPAATAPTPKPPAVWPWIAVVILLSITALALVVALLIGGNNSQPNPNPTQTQPTWSSSPVPSATVPKVALLMSDVLGRSVTDASSYVNGLGLQVVTVPGEALPVGDPRLLTVQSASPLGLLDQGSTVTLIYYIQQTDTASPEPTPTD